MEKSGVRAFIVLTSAEIVQYVGLIYERALSASARFEGAKMGGIDLESLEDIEGDLSALYRFTEIDARAVRKLRPLSLKTDLASVAPAVRARGHAISSSLQMIDTRPQPTFQWGHVGIKALRSLKFQELIGTLKLSAHIESKLVESGLRFVGDLVEDRGTFRRLRSLTHFQIEEVHTALAHYFKSCPTGVVTEFENEHFIRILLAEVESKFAYCFLEQYQLQGILSLSELQKQEVRKWSPSQIAHARTAVLEQLKKGKKEAWIEQTMAKIAGAIILPWMETQGGIATRGEIEEWLDLHSQQPTLTPRITKLLKEMWNWEDFIWRPALLPVQLFRIDNLFASNSGNLKNCERLLYAIERRFCRCGQIYSVEFLLNWVTREWAHHWRQLDQVVALRVLNACKKFKFALDGDEILIEKIA